MTNPIPPQQSDRELADETCAALLQLVAPDRLHFFREALAERVAHHAQQARLEERERCARIAESNGGRVLVGAGDGATYYGTPDAARIATAIRKGEAE